MSAPELDFDELDKAINTVLNDKDVQKEAASFSAAQPASTQPSTAVNASKLSVAEQQAQPKPVAAPAPSFAAPSDRAQGRPPAAPAPNLLTRKPALRSTTPAVRRGVIDIMSPPSKQPSRQGAALRPVSDVKSPPATPSTTTKAPPALIPAPTEPPLPAKERALRWPPKTDEPKPEAETKPTAGQVQEQSHQAFETHTSAPSGSPAHVDDDSFERFDTLSRSGFDFEPEKDGENQPSTESPHTSSSSEQSEQKTAATLDTASPFLSNAKVEKRPLGGYGPTAAVETPYPEVSKDKEPAKQPLVSQGMPADPLLEAHYDDEPKQVIEQGDKPVTAEAVPEGAHTGIKLDHLLDEGSEHKQPAEPSTPSAAPLGMMQSIPQQYKVAEQKHDDKTRPIFDTNEYHAPLSEAAATKKSSVGMWVTLLIILLLAVAGGLFIYFYGSQLGL
ncbi:MAG TPA: hypothetical protein VFZ58_00460 [Candidatus Saccharimonadales bacterium]